MQAKEVIDDKDYDPNKRNYATILYEILKSDLPPEEKTLPRLAQETQTLVGAGTETTGNTLSVTTYHLLEDPNRARRLQLELQSIHPGPAGILEYEQLKKLPYLVREL